MEPRKFVLYDLITHNVLLKAIALTPEMRAILNSDRVRYVLFDSVGEFNLYLRLKELYPKNKIYIHYPIKKPYLSWRVDFMVAGKLYEYKGILDSNFEQVLSVLATFYPSILKELTVVSDNLTCIRTYAKLSGIAYNKKCVTLREIA